MTLITVMSVKALQPQEHHLVIYRYHGNRSLAGAFMATTALYLLLVVCSLVWSKVAPAVLDALEKKRITHMLAVLGMSYSASTSMLLVPGVAYLEEEKEGIDRAAVEKAAVKFM